MQSKACDVRSLLWKAGSVSVVVGCVLTAVMYWNLSLTVEVKTVTTEPNIIRNLVELEAETRPQATTTSRPQTTRKQIDTNPLLILLSYGFVEPHFNPTRVTTSLGYKCVTTTDLRMMNASDAVVVRFSSAFSSNEITKPAVRRPEQFFVYLSLEPPWPFYHHDYSFVDKDYFNWTMTYRRDSDIWFPYYSMDRLMTNVEDRREINRYYGNAVVEKILAQKSSPFTALTVVSHCQGGDGPNHRLLYITALENSGLRLEKRGGCFRNRVYDKWNSTMFRKYCAGFKFFLAFENGYHCRDYVTEKTWSNSLRAGTVPVILGAPKSDVSKLLPAGSFVHADDFANPAELAKYLNYLDSNATAYAEYFNWRRKPPSEEDLSPKDLAYNHLCNKLWEHRLYGNGSKVYHSFKEWYLGQDNPECFKIETKTWLRLSFVGRMFGK